MRHPNSKFRTVLSRKIILIIVLHQNWTQTHIPKSVQLCPIAFSAYRLLPSADSQSMEAMATRARRPRPPRGGRVRDVTPRARLHLRQPQDVSLDDVLGLLIPHPPILI